jgi:hypothetical protein
MGVFTDIELVWAGKVHAIKSHRVMGLIAQMEQFITLTELASFQLRGAVPLARLCQAYAAALKYAGARVEADEIYGAVFSDAETQASVVASVSALMKLMLPAAKRAELEALEAAAEEEALAGDSAPAAPAVGADPGNLDATGAAS